MNKPYKVLTISLLSEMKQLWIKNNNLLYITNMGKNLTDGTFYLKTMRMKKETDEIDWTSYCNIQNECLDHNLVFIGDNSKAGLLQILLLKN